MKYYVRSRCCVTNTIESRFIELDFDYDYLIIDLKKPHYELTIRGDIELRYYSLFVLFLSLTSDIIIYFTLHKENVTKLIIMLSTLDCSSRKPFSVIQTL